MEMPKEKKITLTLFPDGRVYENHGERLWGNGKDCIPWKAVPVPAHGRLIDSDALNKKLQEELGRHNRQRMTASWNDAVLCVLEAPTIIPAQTEKEGQ